MYSIEFIQALEEEKKKILVFERELPLSLQLISQAIQTYKKQMNIDDSEIIASKEPVLEEFLPLRPGSSSSEETNNNNSNNSTININGGNRDNVPDWLRSAQLWNEHPEPIVESVAVQANEAGGDFNPFEREKAITVVLANSDSNDNVYKGNQGHGSHREGKEGNPYRKSRRSWSPELHRRFMSALQELGGPYVATPKMIRELMNVGGLTNDEVKSHLQKYRLHIRRPTTKATHIVLVSNTWASPSEYAISTIATIPPEAKRQHNEHKYNTSPASPLDTRRLIISARGSSATTI